MALLMAVVPILRVLIPVMGWSGSELFRRSYVQYFPMGGQGATIWVSWPHHSSVTVGSYVTYVSYSFFPWGFSAARLEWSDVSLRLLGLAGMIPEGFSDERFNSAAEAAWKRFPTLEVPIFAANWWMFWGGLSFYHLLSIRRRGARRWRCQVFRVSTSAFLNAYTTHIISYNIELYGT